MRWSRENGWVMRQFNLDVAYGVKYVLTHGDDRGR